MADLDPKLYVPKRPRALTLVAGAVLVIVVFVIAAGLVMARNAQLRRQSEELNLEVTKGQRVMVVPVKLTPATRTVEVPGSTSGFNQTPIFAKLPGYLKEIYVDKGDRVARDQVLAILASPETDREVADAEANYRLQKLTDDRTQSLVKRGVVAQQSADQTHSAMLQAKDAWLALRATQDYETIRAPFAGVITTRNVDPGALIPQATTGTTPTPILEMATVQPLRVYAQVPQSEALFIHDGDPAVISVPELPNRQFEGNVSRHAKMLNEMTRTMLVEVDIPNRDSTLYPGMYTMVKFTVHSQPQAPMVPDNSLVFANGKTYLPVVRDDHLKLLEVKLGYDNGLEVQILNGTVRPDELVAINLGQAVADGQPVQPVLVTSAPAQRRSSNPQSTTATN